MSGRDSAGSSRRALLTGTAGTGRTREPVRALGSVAELLALDHKGLTDGTLVSVAGYAAPGDGGGGSLRWAAASRAAGNGGTVLAPSGATAGRWLAVHNGVFDFRRFGIFDTRTNADAALDAMVTDPTIFRIEAHTDLNFGKRHTFGRSTIELDFGGHTVTTNGIEEASHDPNVSPFQAVLCFRGQLTGQAITFTIPEPIAELSDVFPVADSGAFAVGDWYTVEVDPLAGQYERELQKLVQVTQIVDRTHLRVGYRNGWPFAPGRTFTWTKTTPVTDVHIGNLTFVGAGPGTPYGESDWPQPDPDEWKGSHPIAFEYAVRCDVSDVHATGTFWPVVMRRWNTFFGTRRCSLKNPPTVFYGGAGYLTQNIYCLYGHVEDCHTSNARHLNDLTASAYCYVTNCHGDGDDSGGDPFTTHGQYEHDLVFTGCSGLLDLANSGAAWGTSAKRITVRHHVCSWFVANTKITDLTLEDVHVIARSRFDRAGTFVVNADGLRMRGCSGKTFAVGKRSSRSGRPNLISGCVFEVASANVLVQTPVDTPVFFDRCAFTHAEGFECHGTGELSFVDCTVTGKPDGAPISFAGDVVIRGGEYTDTGIVLTAARGQRLHVGGGARLSGTNAAKALISRGAGPGTVTFELRDYQSDAADAETAHVRLDGGTNQYTAHGTRFTGGRLVLAPGAFTGASFLSHRDCVAQGTTRSFPPDGPRVRVDGNLEIQ
ncbi:hypothetical protein [Amycolatopsis samaneae]|uniref:Peptidase C14 n=1 Tax=Amycolatopsis samaneae TaxID=664691 RepID=A0ABW5GMM2_9PSEU